MRPYIAIIMLVASVNIHAESQAEGQNSGAIKKALEAQANNPLLKGPCVSKSRHEEIIPRLTEQKIPFVIHSIKGTPFICYNSEYSEVVDKISDKIYGASPGPNTINLGRKSEMDAFEAKLVELGIPHVRTQYYGEDFIGWENSSDKRVKQVLRESFDTDLDELHKNAIYQ